jgi:hypothetical protein
MSVKTVSAAGGKGGNMGFGGGGGNKGLGMFGNKKDDKTAKSESSEKSL